MSEVERLRVALQRIADEYGDCRCEHDDENCCALVTDYCCPACIAAVALRETLPAAPPAPPMRQKPMTDDWLFTDEFGQTWRLRRTGDENTPLLIELESK